MTRVLMLAFFGSALLVSMSFADTSSSTISDLEKQIASDSANAGQMTAVFPDSTTQLTVYRLEEESNRVLLALSVTGAGLLALFLVLSYLKSREAPPDSMVVGSGLVLVIFATVLIVILVKRDEQLTAATGILGAIAGYLFGKTTGSPSAIEKTTQTENL